MTADKDFYGVSGKIKAGQKFYLQHGQSVVIRGLAPNASYTVTENAEDYASSATISAANGKGGVAYSDPATGSNVAAPACIH